MHTSFLPLTGAKLATLVVSAATLLPISVHAAHINVSESADGSVTIGAIDFEGGFQVQGSPLQQGMHAYGDITMAPSDEGFSFSGSWVDLGASGLGARTIYFVDPSARQQVTDVLSYSWSTNGFKGSISGTFRSAVGNMFGTLPSDVASGNVYLAGQSAGFGLAYLSGNVTAAPVPEPSSVMLAAIGLATAGLAAARRKQQAR